MSIDRRFPVQVAVTFAAGLVVAAILLISTGSQGVVVAVIAGSVLSTLNALAGFLAIEYSLQKPHETFMKAVLGGMGIRMVVMLGMLVFLIKVVKLHTVALVASVLGFYVIYLVLELLYIQKKVSHNSQG
ncbi:MAG: hypothetical protein KF749_06170 [Bacteroidetes bacterium]|nr:hypothetical protein [Bacteroidota bacterium]MCW5894628.1 hypothetical protein [Bacteroidota bacterium]